MQWLYRFIEKRNPTLRAVLQRRQGSLTKLDWDVRLAPGAGRDPRALAARQAAVLRAAYARVEISFMQTFFSHAVRIAMIAWLAFNFTGCATTSGTSSTTSTSATIESALPLIRTGAAVATGAVLDFSVKQPATRTRLANEMYAAASAVYSLSGGSFPSPAQLQSTITTFGGSQTDASYAQFSSAIASLYAAWYPKLATGDTKTASDLLNAVAGGIEDATQSYLTTPVTTGGAS